MFDGINVTQNFDQSEKTVGTLRMTKEAKAAYEKLLASGANIVFAPGYIVRKTHLDINGVTIIDEVELIELSMIPAERAIKPKEKSPEGL